MRDLAEPYPNFLKLLMYLKVLEQGVSWSNAITERIPGKKMRLGVTDRLWTEAALRSPIGLQLRMAGCYHT